MKYIRKVMAAGLVIVFLIALVIGTGVMLSVRNVNVSYIESSGTHREDYENTRQNLNKLKGSGLLFISKADIYNKVSSDEALAVVSYEKKFPCTIDIVLRERVECFALKKESGYDVYDEQGVFLRSKADSEDIPLNPVDGCPDILLKAVESQAENIAELMGYFKTEFGSLRRLVESVSAERYLELSLLTITLRSGMKISVSEWTVQTEAKIKKAYETYSSLTENQRVGGTITVADGRDNSGPVSRYSA